MANAGGLLVLIQLTPRTCLGRALPLVLLLAGCVDRQAGLDDDASTIPGCMAVPAWGHYEDGTNSYIVNEWGRTGTVCMCMTEQELIDQVHEDELTDRAYDECVRMSNLYDFASTDCDTFLEQGKWFGIFAAIEDDAWMNQLGLRCGDDDGSDLGCSLTDGQQPRAPWALLLGVLLIVRRRITATS